MENNKSIGNPVPRHGADVFTYMEPRKKKYPVLYKMGPLPVITGFITPITRVIRTLSHL